MRNDDLYQRLQIVSAKIDNLIGFSTSPFLNDRLNVCLNEINKIAESLLPQENE